MDFSYKSSQFTAKDFILMPILNYTNLDVSFNSVSMSFFHLIIKFCCKFVVNADIPRDSFGDNELIDVCVCEWILLIQFCSLQCM